MGSAPADPRATSRGGPRSPSKAMTSQRSGPRTGGTRWRGRSRCGCLVSLALLGHERPQLLAGLEDRYRTRSDLDRLPGAWIPRHACLPMPDLEGAKSSDLDVPLLPKGLFDRIEEQVDYSRTVLLGNQRARCLGHCCSYLLDEICLGHESPGRQESRTVSRACRLC
jgi:hypothetical protein